MTPHPSARLAEILLVEDELADVELVRETLADSKLVNQLHHVPDGRAALAYLRGVPPFEGASRPDLILLDLNMPIMNGQETLTAIRADPALRTIPVVVMTSSERSEDIARSYELLANCYVRKPIDLDEFQKIVAAIESFWFGVVSLPPASTV